MIASHRPAPAASQTAVSLFDAAQSRAVDAAAIEQLPVPGFVLMQRAAAFACDQLLQHFPGISSISVWCGKGNNAGDAYLLALAAKQAGLRVQLVAVTDPDALSGDAQQAHAAAVAGGLRVHVGVVAPQGEVIVDGLLGTGARGAPREAIVAMQAAGRPILSLDIPSGVDASTGAVVGMAVIAQVTCSFITRKIGAYTGAGVVHVGIREHGDLGVPERLYAAGLALLTWHANWLPHAQPHSQPQAPIASAQGLQRAGSAFPTLRADTHKHRQGRVVVVGGHEHMPGAVILAGTAALKVGAGMVTIITHGAHRSAIVAHTPEIMVLDAQDAQVGSVLNGADVIVCGPGLGRDEWSRNLYDRVHAAQRPTVMDADGLYHLAGTTFHEAGLIVTPHSGEAAHLLDQSVHEVENDRLAAAVQLGERYAAFGVLKGPGSIVFTPTENVGVCAHGNPGMASAGMGDVLSGVVAGLWAERRAYARTEPDDPNLDDRLDAQQAIAGAVCLHSAAADHAAQTTGLRSLMASDVLAALSDVLCGNPQQSRDHTSHE